MSQDLLAEFGDFTLKDNTGSQNHTPTHMQPSTSQSSHHFSSYTAPVLDKQPEDQDGDPWNDNDDDFGDFEEPEPAPQREIQATIREAPIQAVRDIQPATESVSKSTSQPAPQPVKASSGPPVILKKAAKASQLPSNHPFAGHADILFDADEYDEFEDADVVGSWGGEDDEDDFGDFETSEAPVVSSGTPNPTAPPAQPRTVKPSAPAVSMEAVDLLGLYDSPETTDGANQPPAPSRGSKKTISPSEAPTTCPTAVIRQQSVLSDDDAWDDFEISQPSQPAAQTGQAEAQPHIQLPKDILGDLTTIPSTTGVAPSNIPPPSVLLTIFPPILNSLAHQFLQPLITLTSTQKSLLLTNQETQTFLASYVTLTHVLGHVIAGRKSRWKRDKHLAQSMRIGPAMSGRSGGMKLTGLDKSESGREDTAVEVVLAVWREQVGRLRTAVTGASVHGSKLTVPELGDVLPVRVAKGNEGVITSPQACALCGLKREERVAKVDVAVEDSFGEFWVEGTNMHRACLKFWEVFKGRLMSRS